MKLFQLNSALGIQYLVLQSPPKTPEKYLFFFYSVISKVPSHFPNRDSNFILLNMDNLRIVALLVLNEGYSSRLEYKLVACGSCTHINLFHALEKIRKL